MKFTRIFTVMLLFFNLFLFAQGGKKMEQIKSLKIAYITSELSLTADEAEKFWPVYNAFEDRQRDLRRQKAGSYLDRVDSDMNSLTEKEASAALAQMEDNEAALFQARQKFISNLKGILPSVKIIRLKKAEDDFNRKLLRQYREKGRVKQN